MDQPKDGIFAAFGDVRCKIESGEVVQSREMYFAIYQELAEDERRIGLFKSFPPATSHGRRNAEARSPR